MCSIKEQDQRLVDTESGFYLWTDDTESKKVKLQQLKLVLEMYVSIKKINVKSRRTVINVYICIAKIQIMCSSPGHVKHKTINFVLTTPPLNVQH
jgi:hypothetical protein